MYGFDGSSLGMRAYHMHLLCSWHWLTYICRLWTRTQTWMIDGHTVYWSQQSSRAQGRKCCVGGTSCLKGGSKCPQSSHWKVLFVSFLEHGRLDVRAQNDLLWHRWPSGGEKLLWRWWWWGEYCNTCIWLLAACLSSKRRASLQPCGTVRKLWNPLLSSQGEELADDDLMRAATRRASRCPSWDMEDLLLVNASVNWNGFL